METIVIKMSSGMVDEIYSTSKDIEAVIVVDDEDFDEDIDEYEQPDVELPKYRIYPRAEFTELSNREGGTRMKFNEETSMEPRIYEVVQELVDMMAEDRDSERMVRAKLDGVLTAIQALTGEIWTRERIDKVGIVYVANEDDTERIIPTALKFT